MERWREYVDSLPGGLGAYPEFTCKAAIIRSFYRSYDEPKMQADLPRELEQLASAPPPVSVFISEVQARAFYLAMGDAQGWTDDELVRRTRVANDELLSGILYRAIFTFVSSKRLLENIASRWAVFHRGSKASMQSIEPRSCVMLVHEPDFLMSELLARMHGTGVASALAATGVRDVEVISRARPDIRYEARWTT